MKSSRHDFSVALSLFATFAALTALSRLVPIWPLTAGGHLTLIEILMPICGIVLGPYLGSVCSFVGYVGGLALLGMAPYYGAASIISPVVCSALAGYAVEKSAARFFVLLLLPLLLFGVYFSSSIGRAAPLYGIVMSALFFSAGVGALLISLIPAHSPISVKLKTTTILFLGAYGALVGKTFFISIFGGIFFRETPAPIFRALTFISPVERLILAIGVTGAMIIIVPILLALHLERKKSFLKL